MADIAVVFHWPLDTLLGLSVTELARWRERARVRVEPEKR